MSDSYGYARLSSNRRGEKIGCDLQEEDIREAAETNGDRMVKVFRDESTSAWNPNVVREDFEALLAKVRTREPAARRIYLSVVDRFVRQNWDLERLIRIAPPGTVLLTCDGRSIRLDDDGDLGRLRDEVNHAWKSSADTKRRVRKWMKKEAERGDPHMGGHRPFGYQRVAKAVRGDGPALVVDLAEAAVVRGVYAAYLGGASKMAIADWLNAGRVVSSRGRPWSPQMVTELLRSPVVASWRSHRRLVVPADGSDPHSEVDLVDGHWESIVTRDVWEEVQARMREASRSNSPDPSRYLVSGLVRCHCGAKMGTQVSAARGARNYACLTRAPYLGCGGCSVSVRGVDGFMAELLAAVLADPDAPRPGDRRADERLAALAAKGDAERLLAELAEDYGSGAISRAERDRSRVGPAERLAAAERVLEDRAPRVDLITEGRLWEDLEWPARRAVARAYMRAVLVGPAVRFGRVFDRGRIDVDWR